MVGTFERCQQVDTSKEENLPYLIRWKGSVAKSVILQTLFVTAFAAAVTVVYYKTNIKPSIPQTFIPVLGFVVGLLLTYRTNTAYDRYWEGRKAWSSMVVAIRNLTRYIWVCVKRVKTEREKIEAREKKDLEYLDHIKNNNELKEKYYEVKKYDELKNEREKKLKGEEIEDEEISKKRKEVEEARLKEEDKEILLEKQSAVRLLIGFAFAVKHYLREEEGDECDDVKPFISNIRSNLPGFEDLSVQDTVGENTADDTTDDTPQKSIWRKISSCISLFKNKKKPHHGKDEEMKAPNHNLPLEISLYISDYIKVQFRKGRIGVPLTNNMLLSINSLIECLTAFERILRTPIPLAYSIHLSQTVWIYCLSLPFQLVNTVGWSTIPIVFLASFILLGIERIAAEIENPFGYDPNDLDLDGFCKIIEREITIITSHVQPSVDEWVFNDENRPFVGQEISALHARDNLSFKQVRHKLLDESIKNIPSKFFADSKKTRPRPKMRSRFSMASLKRKNTNNENFV
ncbi:Bestrophin, RFP-TM, chloride channel-domain-containing protein [Gigaspora rosea]|uniref:Bestrophin, RFP-TM, chloride channel-domain-containing protein n=1 Tax=Gigaspora rosea TaxID=44941 RepID=A0A397V9Q8_9GLOM|nr:Bestrophin, RFP-TM, chloride channel-domain-containing protein [Gigaspora rosea]